ncbi:hypothetical protein SKAU_G00153790 [Synaphobranchus kaupii]|uniref:Uncharacterized protein n=1 Tax=Synaphobranchus kaupii TaxID=118154 RepID=A0A9Q1FHH6_SYNKA|nr:hypothetical protein SKAU_G00153790 [Synaphobranchus kaupii]
MNNKADLRYFGKLKKDISVLRSAVFVSVVMLHLRLGSADIIIIAIIIIDTAISVSPANHSPALGLCLGTSEALASEMVAVRSEIELWQGYA